MEVFHVPSAVVITPRFSQGGVPSWGAFECYFLLFHQGQFCLFYLKGQPRTHVHHPPVPWSTGGVWLVGSIFLHAEKMGVPPHKFGESFPHHSSLLLIFLFVGLEIHFGGQIVQILDSHLCGNFYVKLCACCCPIFFFHFCFCQRQTGLQIFLLEGVFHGGSQ